jgi:hypothetical protein
MDSLAKATPKKMQVGLRITGGKMPFTGLDKKEKRQEFMRLLDQAKLGLIASESLKAYTADNQNYYQIKVLERAPRSEILTFAEAIKDGTMDEVRVKALENYYIVIREQNPEAYQKENQEWKSFKNVRESVEDHYFNNILTALQPIQKSLFVGEKEPANWSKDQAASLRFYPHFQRVKMELEKNPSLVNGYVKKQDEIQDSHRYSLKDQWLLEKTHVSVTRQDPKGINIQEAFQLPLAAWSNISTPVNGDLSFFQVQERGVMDSKKDLAMTEQTKKAQAILSANVQRILMQHMLEKIKAKGAISLSYLQIPQENSGLETSNTEF